MERGEKLGADTVEKQYSNGARKERKRRYCRKTIQQWNEKRKEMEKKVQHNKCQKYVE